jgi:thiamine-monophosphate kinase
MPLSEIALIERYFSQCAAERPDVELGIGDDAALLRCPDGHDLVAAIDTLVESVHFLPHAAPASIGHRALAVNLSDLAAMGARPAWALMALTLPQPDEGWLEEFARGFGTLARAHEVSLVGGNTTRGPLCISVQVLGHVPHASALRRSGARSGDALFLSGTAGDAAAGLLLDRGQLPLEDALAARELRERFAFPTPRVALGERLRTHASACIDVSDGLLGDAAKLAAASGCGVEIEFEALPVSRALVSAVGEEQARRLALSGGEDYELCFSVPSAHVEALQCAVPPARWNYRRIGTLRDAPDILVTRAGTVMQFSHSGFDHFGA